MKYLIITLLLLSSCTPTEYSNENEVFIGDKRTFIETYKFYYGTLEHKTNRGWQLDIQLESDSVLVQINKHQSQMYEIINKHLFILHGKKGDNYKVVEIRIGDSNE